MDDYEVVKAEAAAAVGKLDPAKPFGTPLFNAMNRVNPVVAFECVALRVVEPRGIEVFMVLRPEGEDCYPGYWHVPGSILRNTEEEDHVFARLQDREFHTAFRRLPRFVDRWNNPKKEPRGHHVHMIFLVQLMHEPPVGPAMGWFPINQLPEKTIPYHRDELILRALREFMS